MRVRIPPDQRLHRRLTFDDGFVFALGFWACTAILYGILYVADVTVFRGQLPGFESLVEHAIREAARDR